MKTFVTTALTLLGLVLFANAMDALLFESVSVSLVPMIGATALLGAAIARLRPPLLIRIENRQYLSY